MPKFVSYAAPGSSFARDEAMQQQLLARYPEMPVDAVGLLRLLQHVYRQFDRRIGGALAAVGLAAWDFKTLLVLEGFADEGCPMIQLAELAGEKRTNMTRICDGLEARGFIERLANPADGRSFLVRSTPKARALMGRLLPTSWSRLAGVIGRLSDAQRTHMRSALLEISRYFDETTAVDLGAPPAPAAPRRTKTSSRSRPTRLKTRRK
jgi:DNA-binding MarR family transcriptional regulator